MRRPLLIAGLLVAIAACTAFSAADPATDAPLDAGATGADPDAAAGSDAPNASSDDPCRGAPATKEYAGLYLAGGTESGGATPESAKVRRAPLLCDGSVGAFVALDAAHDLPRTVAGAGALVAGDRVVVFGGQHSSGGPAYSLQPQIAARQPDGTLGPFELAPAVEGIDRWRFAVAHHDDAAYVLGGELQGRFADFDGGLPSPGWKLLSDAGGIFKAKITRVDRLSLTGSGQLASMPMPDLYAPRSRFGAAIADGVLHAYGCRGPNEGEADDKVHGASVQEGGGLGPWEDVGALTDAQSDTIVVATAHEVWFLGGGRDSNALAVSEQIDGKRVLTRLKPLARAVNGGVALVSRGFVYLVLDGARTLLYGKLDRAGLDLTDGPDIGAALGQPTMFVF